LMHFYRKRTLAAGVLVALATIGLSAPTSAATVVPVDTAGCCTYQTAGTPFVHAPTELAVSLDVAARINAFRVAANMTALPVSTNLTSLMGAWTSTIRTAGACPTVKQPGTGLIMTNCHSSGTRPDGTNFDFLHPTFLSSYLTGLELAFTTDVGLKTGAIVNLWEGSPPHHAEMLDPTTDFIGVGVACLANGSAYIVVSMGSTASASLFRNRPAGWSDPHPANWPTEFPPAGTAWNTYGVNNPADGITCGTSTPPTSTTTTAPSTTSTTMSAPPTTVPPVAPAVTSTLDTTLPTVRLADTRNTGTLPAGGVLSVPVAAGATAAVLQATAVGHGSAGYLTVYPCGQIPTASNVNYPPSGASSSAATVQLDSGGNVCVYTSAAADVIIDRAAVYRPAVSARQGRFTPAVPIRILDTRQGTPFSAGEERTFTAPAGVSAVSLNVTAVDASGDGFLTVYPGPSGGNPGNSSLNFTAGRVRANAVIVGVDQAGRFTVRAQVATGVLIDLNGSFTDSTAPVASTGLFHPIPPARAFDSRPNPMVTAGQATSRSTTNVGVPVNALATISTITAIPTVAGFVTTFAPSGPIPATSTSNPYPGVATPNMAITSGSAIGVYASADTMIIGDVSGYFEA
jgi:hypothetical protein